MKIKEIAIEAFRCFDYQYLSFEAGEGVLANLVVLYAPNGFGKTSLFDAIEYGITGSVNRFMRGVYQKDNMIDKGLRDKHSFLFNKNVDAKRNIHVAINFDGTFNDIDRTFSVADENMFSSKLQTRNDFFKNVILSQEWFDSFIRSTTPEERCKIFFEYFNRKDSLLAYNKELEDTKSKLKSIKSNKEADVKKLKNSLNKAIQGDALLVLQEKLEQVSELGWEIPSFKQINIDSLNAMRIWGQEKLDNVKSVLDVNEEKITKILAVLDGTSEIATIVKIEDCYVRRNGLAKEILELKSYREKQERLFLLQKKQSENLEQINLVEKDKKVFDFYISNEKKIAELLYKLSHLKNDKMQKEANAVDLQRHLSELNQEKTELHVQKIETEETLKGILPIHTDLKRLFEQYRTNKYKKIKNEINVKKIKLQNLLLQDSNAEKDKDIKRIEAFSKALEHSVDEGLLSYGLYRDQVLSLLDDWKKLREIGNTKSVIDNKKKGHELYKSEVQRLVDNSRTIYSELDNGVCPLCGYDWKNVEELIKSIEGNHAIDATISLLSEQYEEQVNKEKEIVEHISAQKNELRDAVRHDILAIQDVIAFNNNKIESNNKDIHRIQDEQENLDSEIEKYSNIFGELDFDQLKEKIESEYQTALKRNSEVKKKLAETVNTISLEEKQLQLCQREIKKISSEYAAYHLDGFYQKTKECYKSLDYYLDNKLVDYWKEKSHSLGQTLDMLNEKMSDIKSEIEDLHSIGVNEFDKDAKNEEMKCLAEEHTALLQTFEKLLKFLKGLVVSCDFSIENNSNEVKGILQSELEYLKENRKIQNGLQTQLVSFMNLVDKADEYLGYNRNLSKIREQELEIEDLKDKLELLNEEKVKLSAYVRNYVDKFFDHALINKLYNTIDPHPKYKEINFDCDFDKQTPRLCVKMSTVDGQGNEIVPNLYFSSAQINILSFCIFMAKALNATDDKGNKVECMFIDDPIQAMDDINVLSVVDLLRNVAFVNNKQVVITTHDRNFYELLKKKCPSYIFNSKFFKFLEKGRIIEDA